MAVYKDKKRGTWYVSLYYTDWTGKQQRKLKRGFSTKKEAQDWERHFSLEKASSLDMTFGDFYKRYTDDVKPKLRENTWKSKEYVIELKILPYFKDLVMREITPRDVIAWQNEMRKCESQDGEKYKGTYLRKMQAELSAIICMVQPIPVPIFQALRYLMIREDAWQMAFVQRYIRWNQDTRVSILGGSLLPITWVIHPLHQ